MNQRNKLEQLCRYITRPAIANERLKLNAKIRSKITPSKPVTVNDTSDDLDNVPHHSPSARMSWAWLLKRVFDIDIEHCPHCQRFFSAN